MSVANSRDPGILEEFESSFGQTSKPRDELVFLMLFYFVFLVLIYFDANY